MHPARGYVTTLTRRGWLCPADPWMRHLSYADDIDRVGRMSESLSAQREARISLGGLRRYDLIGSVLERR